MKKKKCSYNNSDCFNLEEVQEDAKKVKAKDVFEGYKDNTKPKKRRRLPLKQRRRISIKSAYTQKTPLYQPVSIFKRQFSVFKRRV